MIIVEPKAEIVIMRSREEILKNIEKVGRVAYKSEDKITDESAPKFVSMLVKRGHWAVLEHENITVKFTTNRGVSHEIVRHRVASFCQESTRYVNYGKQDSITICRPSWLKDELTEGEYRIDECEVDSEFTEVYKKIDNDIWKPFDCNEVALCQLYAWSSAEVAYMMMLDLGCTPQQARGVLPNDTKTEIVMTANLREWKHFLDLRSKGTTGAPHPDMKELADLLNEQLVAALPEVFGE